MSDPLSILRSMDGGAVPCGGPAVWHGGTPQGCPLRYLPCFRKGNVMNRFNGTQLLGRAISA
jgi:hypothetical protein